MYRPLLRPAMARLHLQHEAIAIGFLIWCGLSGAAPIEQVEALIRTVEDVEKPPLERQSALARLDAISPVTALEHSEKLLNEKNGLLRTRAAWILADSGRQAGIAALEQIAGRRTEEEDVIAIKALGRLRVKRSHAFLRRLLESELTRPTPSPVIPPRVSALVVALGDYGDPSDGALMSTAVRRWLGPDSWPWINALGKTGGADAVPVLSEAFRSSPEGMTKLMAALALARCGSELGQDFVRSRLGELHGLGENSGERKYRAGELILEHMGTPGDEVFAPVLLALTGESAADRTKALAWDALLRINPVSQRQTLLEAAWRNTIYQAAVRLIALNDEATAREVVAQVESGAKPTRTIVDARLMRRALDASDREKRRWREIEGYAF